METMEQSRIIEIYREALHGFESILDGLTKYELEKLRDYGLDYEHNLEPKTRVQVERILDERDLPRLEENPMRPRANELNLKLKNLIDTFGENREVKEESAGLPNELPQIQQKVLVFEKLGVVDLIRTQLVNPSNSELAKLLSILTGLSKGAIEKTLNRITNNVLNEETERVADSFLSRFINPKN